MDLGPHLTRIGADLDRVTALADEQTREVSRRLATALEPGLRLAMTELLADAAAQLTARLHGAVVTVRMDGAEPVLQVTETAAAEPAPPPAATADEDPEDGTARVTVRLPDGLKRRAEALAQSSRQSLNTWIVQTIRSATEHDTNPAHRTNRRLTGWA